MLWIPSFRIAWLANRTNHCNAGYRGCNAALMLLAAARLLVVLKPF